MTENFLRQTFDQVAQLYATKPFAKKGFDITAVEPGTALSAVAKHELCDYKNVKIPTGTFEEITLPAKSFDLNFCDKIPFRRHIGQIRNPNFIQATVSVIF